MKVVSIGQNYHIVGGSDRYLIDLAALLEQHGHESAVFAARHDKNLPSRWSEYFPVGSNFDRAGLADIGRFIYSPEARMKMQALVRDFAPDIAHLHIYYGKITSSILAPLADRGVPVVQTLHEYKIVCPTYTMIRNGKQCYDCAGGRFYHCLFGRCNGNRLDRSLLSAVESYVSRRLGAVDKVSRFICVSQAQKDIIVKMGIPEEKCTVIHNFIGDIPADDQVEYRGEGVLYMGRLEKEKGIYDAIEACGMTGQRLVIAGSGKEAEAARAFVSARGYANIEFAGFVGREVLSRLIRAAACIVVPSLWEETFGLVAAEGMSYGKPVIASRIGGLPEVVEDGKTGYLYDPGNVRQLAEKIDSLVSKPGQAAMMGKQARQRVLGHFTAEAHYNKIMALYAEVIAHGKA